MGDFPNNATGYAIAGVCAVVSICVSCWNINKHLKYYTVPKLQIQIVRILLIVPIYALVSWLSMVFGHESRPYFETIRDIYEAIVIYCFLALILEYIGGELQCLTAISKKPSMKHPVPCCCLPRLALDVRFLRMCKQGCLQFIVSKPIMAVLSIIMLATDLYDSMGYTVFMLSVYNISYTIALYALLLFYLATADVITGFSPVRKFLAVKAVVFATYYQSLLFRCIPGYSEDEIAVLNDFILCLEMVPFAILHSRSFPWWEFQTNVHGFSPEVEPEQIRGRMQNMSQVLGVRDIVRDAVHNFNPSYASYALSGDFERTSVEMNDQEKRSPGPKKDSDQESYSAPVDPYQEESKTTPVLQNIEFRSDEEP